MKKNKNKYSNKIEKLSILLKDYSKGKKINDYLKNLLDEGRVLTVIGDRKEGKKINSIFDIEDFKENTIGIVFEIVSVNTEIKEIEVLTFCEKNYTSKFMINELSKDYVSIEYLEIFKLLSTKIGKLLQEVFDDYMIQIHNCINPENNLFVSGKLKPLK